MQYGQNKMQWSVAEELVFNYCGEIVMKFFENINTPLATKTNEVLKR